MKYPMIIDGRTIHNEDELYKFALDCQLDKVDAGMTKVYRDKCLKLKEENTQLKNLAILKLEEVKKLCDKNYIIHGFIPVEKLKQTCEKVIKDLKGEI